MADTSRSLSPSDGQRTKEQDVGKRSHSQEYSRPSGQDFVYNPPGNSQDSRDTSLVTLDQQRLNLKERLSKMKQNFIKQKKDFLSIADKIEEHKIKIEKIDGIDLNQILKAEKDITKTLEKLSKIRLENTSEPFLAKMEETLEQATKTLERFDDLQKKLKIAFANAIKDLLEKPQPKRYRPNRQHAPNYPRIAIGGF